eukprot:14767697-Ditylum_brightwellii.AAC.2
MSMVLVACLLVVGFLTLKVYQLADLLSNLVVCSMLDQAQLLVPITMTNITTRPRASLARDISPGYLVLSKGDFVLALGTGNNDQDRGGKESITDAEVLVAVMQANEEDGMESIKECTNEMTSLVNEDLQRTPKVK